MPGRIEYFDADAALQILLKNVSVKLREEFINTEKSFGRTLSADVHAPASIPPRDLSHVDGYALRSNDLKKASQENLVTLNVVGKSGPFEVPSSIVKKGECWRILTGGFLPAECDVVVMQEDVVRKGDTIVVKSPIDSGENVVPEGLDVKKGALLFGRGHTLVSQDVGLLLALKVAKVQVFARPRVAILSVGSELTDRIDQTNGKVVNSHLHTIYHLVSEAGGEPISLGIASDDVDAIVPLLKKGLEIADIVSTIGGSSVGPADLVSESINYLGTPGVLVHGLKVQPARVAGFGVAQGKPIFILPGLIQSTINAYAFLTYPLIRYLLGKEARRYAFSVKARLESDLIFRSFREFRHITWVTLLRDGDGYIARPNLGDSSLLSVIVRSQGYVVTPEGKDARKGELVDVNFLPGAHGLDSV